MPSSCDIACYMQHGAFPVDVKGSFGNPVRISLTTLLSCSLSPRATAGLGHKDQFPPLKLSGRCGFESGPLLPMIRASGGFRGSSHYSRMMPGRGDVPGAKPLAGDRRKAADALAEHREGAEAGWSWRRRAPRSGGSSRRRYGDRGNRGDRGFGRVGTARHIGDRPQQRRNRVE